MKEIVQDEICAPRRKERDSILKDLILALSVCHNVTPLEGGNF